jgi:hypothetical protein
MRPMVVPVVLVTAFLMTACHGGPSVPTGPAGFQTKLGGMAFDSQFAMGTTGQQNQTQYTGGDSAALGQLGSAFGGFGGMTGADPFAGFSGFGGMPAPAGFGGMPFGGATGVGGLAPIGLPAGFAPMGGFGF